MRTLILRSIQALVSISAVVLLTGANDAGCGFGSETGGGTTGTSGTAGSDPGTGIVCPDGTQEQWVCSGMAHPGTEGCAPTPVPCDCPPPPDCPPGVECPVPDIACVCPEPPPPSDDCVLQCVPVSNVCPDGFHSELVCDPTEPPPPPMDPSDAGLPTPGMGGTEPSFPGYPGGACNEVCMPDNACPPGTVQQTVCSGGGMVPSDPNDPATPPAMDACWNECVPVDPTCPPGSHEEVACPANEMGAPCQLTCVPDGAPCPAGQHAEQQCTDNGMGQGTCTLTCVDDAPMAN